MKNNKFLGIILWAIGLLVAHLLIFCVPENYTAAVWITYGFTLFAFLSQLALWLYTWRKSLDAKEMFLHTPAFMLSICYMLLQLVLCAVFTLWSTASVKVAILLNVLLSIAIWVLLVLSEIAKNHIAQVNCRQKDHHIEL